MFSKITIWSEKHDSFKVLHRKRVGFLELVGDRLNVSRKFRWNVSMNLYTSDSAFKRYYVVTTHLKIGIFFNMLFGKDYILLSKFSIQKFLEFLEFYRKLI